MKVNTRIMIGYIVALLIGAFCGITSILGKISNTIDRATFCEGMFLLCFSIYFASELEHYEHVLIEKVSTNNKSKCLRIRKFFHFYNGTYDVCGRISKGGIIC